MTNIIINNSMTEKLLELSFILLIEKSF